MNIVNYTPSGKIVIRTVPGACGCSGGLIYDDIEPARCHACKQYPCSMIVSEERNDAADSEHRN